MTAQAKSLVTIEWQIFHRGRPVTVEVDADEEGEPHACRVADTSEVIPVEHFKKQLGDYSGRFAHVVSRLHARVRRLAGITTQ